MKYKTDRASVRYGVLVISRHVAFGANSINLALKSTVCAFYFKFKNWEKSRLVYGGQIHAGGM